MLFYLCFGIDSYVLISHVFKFGEMFDVSFSIIQKGLKLDFFRFHLYKENKDTQEAIGLIGKMLGIQVRQFLCNFDLPTVGTMKEK